MIRFQEYEKEIAIISLTYAMLHYRGIGVKESVDCIIQHLKLQYDITGDKRYLETALLNIQAFLNCGFLYEEKENQFDEILRLLNCTKSQVFPRRFYSSKRIKPNKEQVRKLISRWRPSKENPMKMGEVVEDIIDKVVNKRIGTYFYQYTTSYERNKKSDMADCYELVVKEEECFFFDVKNLKYYTFY